jgi:hypothetical protein
LESSTALDETSLCVHVVVENMESLTSSASQKHLITADYLVPALNMKLNIWLIFIYNYICICLYVHIFASRLSLYYVCLPPSRTQERSDTSTSPSEYTEQ